MPRSSRCTPFTLKGARQIGHPGSSQESAIDVGVLVLHREFHRAEDAVAVERVVAAEGVHRLLRQLVETYRAFIDGRPRRRRSGRAVPVTSAGSLGARGRGADGYAVRGVQGRQDPLVEVGAAQVSESAAPARSTATRRRCGRWPPSAPSSTGRRRRRGAGLGPVDAAHRPPHARPRRCRPRRRRRSRHPLRGLRGHDDPRVARGPARRRRLRYARRRGRRPEGLAARREGAAAVVVWGML